MRIRPADINISALHWKVICRVDCCHIDRHCILLSHADTHWHLACGSYCSEDELDLNSGLGSLSSSQAVIVVLLVDIALGGWHVKASWEKIQCVRRCMQCSSTKDPDKLSPPWWEKWRCAITVLGLVLMIPFLPSWRLFCLLYVVLKMGQEVIDQRWSHQAHSGSKEMLFTASPLVWTSRSRVLFLAGGLRAGGGRSSGLLICMQQPCINMVVVHTAFLPASQWLVALARDVDVV